jgi:hypothetical protein
VARFCFNEAPPLSMADGREWIGKMVKILGKGGGKALIPNC